MPISRPPPRQAVSRLRPSPYNEPPTSARNKECGPATADGTVIRACRSESPTDPDGAHPRPDGIETDGATWCDPAAAVALAMHPAMRLRLQDAVSAPDRTHFD